MQWKRFRKEETSVALHRIRESRDGKFRVVYSHITCGEGQYPDCWYAMKKTDAGWRIISRHKKDRAAMAACAKEVAKAVVKAGRRLHEYVP